MSYRINEIEKIHSNFMNGNYIEMRQDIIKYNVYYFLDDYRKYLKDLHSSIDDQRPYRYPFEVASHLLKYATIEI